MGQVTPAEISQSTIFEQATPVGQPGISIEEGLLVVRIPWNSISRFVELNREPLSDLNALVKAALSGDTPEVEDEGDTITFASGLCTFNEQQHEFAVGDAVVDLRPKSFRLLAILAKHINEPVSIADLILELDGVDESDSTAFGKRRSSLLNRVGTLREECNDALSGLGDPTTGMIRSIRYDRHKVGAFMLRKKLKRKELDDILTNRGEQGIV